MHVGKVANIKIKALALISSKQVKRMCTTLRIK